MGISIYYFSGTGNCHAAAKQLRDSIGGEIHAITKESQMSKPSIKCDTCVIMTPSYAYGLPKLVRQFLRSATFDCNYFAAIATCGTSSGSVLGEIGRILKRKGQKLDYATSVQTVENYVHIFGFPDKEKVKGGTEKQQTGIKIASHMIKMKGKRKADRCKFIHRVVSRIFYIGAPIFAKSYKTNENCTACGLCQKACPAAAITMQDGKPRFSAKSCNHCQCCLNICPSRAIKYMKTKPNSPRYLHPDVQQNEFIKR